MEKSDDKREKYCDWCGSEFVIATARFDNDAELNCCSRHENDFYEYVKECGMRLA